MKRSGLLLILCALFIFSSCEKDKTTYYGNFWKTDHQANEVLGLYLNDSYVGVLPYLPKAPTCEPSDTMLTRTLPFELKAGRYELTAKDQSGNEVATGTVKISENSLSSSAKKGSISISNTGNCVLISFGR